VVVQVVPDARNVGRDFDSVGQPHARHLAQRRVRLLRGLREHPDTDTALLRAVLERRALRLRQNLVAPFAHELADRRHGRTAPVSGGAWPPNGTTAAKQENSATPPNPGPQPVSVFHASATPS